MSALEQSSWRHWWPLPLRLATGGALSVAGAFKLFSSLGHRNIASELVALGVPAPEPMAWVVGGAELLCGVGLLLGMRTAASALVMLANLGGLVVLAAIGGIARPEDLVLAGLGFFPYRLPSYEAAAVLIAALLALLLGGAGPCSFDDRPAGAAGRSGGALSRTS